MPPLELVGPIRSTEHRGQDDLLTAGLGAAGLRNPVPPAFADPTRPTASEARRRAIWASWRGIADLTPGGGFGRLYGSFAPVPGREFHGLARLPGAREPHRVALQVPDTFDPARPCVVVAPASGSRGVYGAIAVAASWALPRGCAVAYTDKGAGSDYFDLDTRTGVGPDGTPAAADAAVFAPEGATGVAFKHAHSRDNPEADWGRHVRQATAFALHALGQAYPDRAPFAATNTRLIGAAISNGGGALLRAVEADRHGFDAVVTGEPNVWVAGAPPLYDIATEAALLMPCALSALGVPLPATVGPTCGEAAAWLGVDTAKATGAALEQLRARGWTDDALRAGALSSAFDLWRAVAVTYASAYGRFAHDAHPCGFSFGATEADGGARAATAPERAAWWSDAAGIPPGAGVALRAPPGSATASLQCLRALHTGTTPAARAVQAGIAATRAAVPADDVPVVVVHGTHDGLVPAAFTSTPYVAAARAAGRRNVRYWRVDNAQHFDAFLALPVVGARYVPLIPHVHAALDRVWAHLERGEALPDDANFAARRTSGELDAAQLALP